MHSISARIFFFGGKIFNLWKAHVMNNKPKKKIKSN